MLILDLHKDLVDNEGFPRADLDFLQLQKYRESKKKYNGRHWFFLEEDSCIGLVSMDSYLRENG